MYVGQHWFHLGGTTMDLKDLFCHRQTPTFQYHVVCIGLVVKVVERVLCFPSLNVGVLLGVLFGRRSSLLFLLLLFFLPLVFQMHVSQGIFQGTRKDTLIANPPAANAPSSGATVEPMITASMT